MSHMLTVYRGTELLLRILHHRFIILPYRACDCPVPGFLPYQRRSQRCVPG